METSCGRCCPIFCACFASCILVTCMLILYTIIMLILMIIVSNYYFDHESGSSMLFLAVVLISFFLFQGSIIIFPVKRSVQFSNPNALEYCHPTLYNCAFWTLIVYYVIFALSLTSVLIFCLYIYLDDHKK